MPRADRCRWRSGEWVRWVTVGGVWSISVDQGSVWATPVASAREGRFPGRHGRRACSPGAREGMAAHRFLLGAATVVRFRTCGSNLSRPTSRWWGHRDCLPLIRWARTRLRGRMGHRSTPLRPSGPPGRRTCTMGPTELRGGSRRLYSTKRQSESDLTKLRPHAQHQLHRHLPYSGALRCGLSYIGPRLLTLLPSRSPGATLSFDDDRAGRRGPAPCLRPMLPGRPRDVSVPSRSLTLT